MIRESIALVDLPNVWLFKTMLGLFGFTWFGRLNASALNSTDWPSLIWNLRVRPISSWMIPGPRRLLAAFPYTPEAGRANAAAFSQPSRFLLGRYGSASTC